MAKKTKQNQRIEAKTPEPEPEKFGLDLISDEALAAIVEKETQESDGPLSHAGLVAFLELEQRSL